MARDAVERLFDSVNREQRSKSRSHYATSIPADLTEQHVRNALDQHRNGRISDAAEELCIMPHVLQQFLKQHHSLERYRKEIEKEHKLLIKEQAVRNIEDEIIEGKNPGVSLKWLERNYSGEWAEKKAPEPAVPDKLENLSFEEIEKRKAETLTGMLNAIPVEMLQKILAAKKQKQSQVPLLDKPDKDETKA